MATFVSPFEPYNLVTLFKEDDLIVLKWFQIFTEKEIWFTNRRFRGKYVLYKGWINRMETRYYHVRKIMKSTLYTNRQIIYTKPYFYEHFFTVLLKSGTAHKGSFYTGTYVKLCMKLKL